MSRKVTVYNTLGNNKSEIQTTATTWSELQADLNAANISYSGMKAVIGQSQVTLESANATLAEGDFTLFLMPQKVKSGFGDWDNEEDDYFSDEEEQASASPATQAVIKIQQAVELMKEAITLVQQAAGPQDEESRKLAQEAEELRRNMDLFN